ncbi:hypothetical protein Bbelb_233090 [Branchiostoma belcheri]|nr:hypothetical protein Bbelb_233090 [Branchiostoma belcheri]
MPAEIRRFNPVSTGVTAGRHSTREIPTLCSVFVLSRAIKAFLTGWGFKRPPQGCEGLFYFKEAKPDKMFNSMEVTAVTKTKANESLRPRALGHFWAHLSKHASLTLKDVTT